VTKQTLTFKDDIVITLCFLFIVAITFLSLILEGAFNQKKITHFYSYFLRIDDAAATNPSRDLQPNELYGIGYGKQLMMNTD
jgi:hypothetical protein